MRVNEMENLMHRLTDNLIKRFRFLSMAHRMKTHQSPSLDELASEQKIEEPTDIKTLWGYLEGAVDDDFLQAIRRQREHK